MPARLVALDGTPDIPLDGLLVIVGRDRKCDVRLDSSRVSRLHCCLALGVGEVLVRDLGSTNGLRINGREALEGAIRPDDVLAIAHLRFRLAWGDGECRDGSRPPGHVGRHASAHAGGPDPGATPPIEGPADGRGPSSAPRRGA